jgi:hypothetical protein
VDRKSTRDTAEGVPILCKHLLEKVLVSEVCDEHALQPTVQYRRQKQFFEGVWRFFCDAPGRDSRWLGAGVCEERYLPRNAQKCPTKCVHYISRPAFAKHAPHLRNSDDFGKHCGKQLSVYLTVVEVCRALWPGEQMSIMRGKVRDFTGPSLNGTGHTAEHSAKGNASDSFRSCESVTVSQVDLRSP